MKEDVSTENAVDANLSGTYPPEDLLKILLATDIHLGYGEKDAARGEKVFITLLGLKPNYNLQKTLV